VFIGLTEIAGFYANLKHGLEQLGIPCTFINLNDHPFDYGGDSPNKLASLTRVVAARWRLASDANRFSARMYSVVYRILKGLLFFWALVMHDVFMFGFNSSFFNSYRDLPILRLAKKRIIYTFFGSDARPPYLNGSIMAEGGGITIEECLELTQRKKRDLRIIERHANVLVNYLYDGYFHERPFVSATQIGIPYKPKGASVGYRIPDSAITRVLHAPSSPESKGTPGIREAVSRLQEKGYPVELIEISGRPNVEVLNEIAKCDFVVDQIYTHALMAGFATEAAFLGKPAIVAGYNPDAIRDAYPDDMVPPVHFCQPDEVESAIKRLIVDVQYRESLGAEAKRFVESEWIASRVAQRYLRVIENDIPAAWFCDPMSIQHICAWGLTKERLKLLLREMVEIGGATALQLCDKPELKRKALELAYA
jgi:hypothetical protein